MKTSEQLRRGTVYTRAELREQFRITDSTINNGVFRPKGHDSVWLFVTGRKEADMTEYDDSLDGDVLRWDGQMSGRTDRVIMEHERLGLELLVFYRESKREHPGGGFRYEGTFNYLSHAGGSPTHFRLGRLQ